VHQVGVHYKEYNAKIKSYEKRLNVCQKKRRFNSSLFKSEVAVYAPKQLTANISAITTVGKLLGFTHYTDNHFMSKHSTQEVLNNLQQGGLKTYRSADFTELLKL
jgi:hypothetical protein